MSEEQNTGKAGDSNPEGNPENNPNAGDSNNNEPSKTNEVDVSGLKSKNSELLGVNKKLKEKLKELETEKKQREESELKDQNKWKEYAELKDKEAQEAKEELANVKSSLTNGKKMAAFLKHAPVKEKFWDQIDLDQIAVNPDSGKIDEASVASYAEKFKEEFFETLEGSKKPDMPQDAPNNNFEGGLTREKYKKMSPKEKREHAAEFHALQMKERGMA